MWENDNELQQTLVMDAIFRQIRMWAREVAEVPINALVVMHGLKVVAI